MDLSSLTTVDAVIVTLYLLAIFAVGMMAGRNVKTLDEYAVAGRSYSALILFATLSASFIGGGFSSGNAAKVYGNGLGYALTLWGFSLAMFLIAVKLAPRADHFRHCISVGDIMSTHLGRTGKVVTGLLGCFLCVGILAAQVGAMGAVFSTFTPLSFEQGVFVGCSIVIVYTTFGGMRSVVLTDVIQFGMLVTLIPLALFIGVMEMGGLEALLAKVPTNHMEIFSETMTPTLFLGLFLSFMIGESLAPPYIQRLLAGKSGQTTAKGMLYSALTSVPFFIVTGMVGLLALALDPTINPNESMPFILKVVLPVGLTGLAIAAVLSIVMSSADSFLNSAVVCLIRDVAEPLWGRKLTKNERDELLLARVLTLIIGVSSVVIALKIRNVLDILLFSYQFYAPVVVVPLVMTMLGYTISRASFLLGAICGSATVLVFLVLGGETFVAVDTTVIGTLAGAIGFFGNHWIESHFRKAAQANP